MSESTSAVEGSAPSASSDAGAPQQQQPSSGGPFGGASKNKFKQIELPTGEQMMMEDVMGNCFVKTAVSGVMGGLAGVAFGLFSASMENAHGVSRAPLD